MGSKVVVDSLMRDCVLDLGVLSTTVDLCVISLGPYGVVLAMDWLESHQARIDCHGKRAQSLDDCGKSVEIVGI